MKPKPKAQYVELRPGGRYRNGQSERRYIYALLRQAGYPTLVARKIRDWQLESVYGSIGIHMGDQFAREALGVIDPHFLTRGLPKEAGHGVHDR